MSSLLEFRLLSDKRDTHTKKSKPEAFNKVTSAWITELFLILEQFPYLFHNVQQEHANILSNNKDIQL
jgi:hypothetical protein